MLQVQPETLKKCENKLLLPLPGDRTLTTILYMPSTSLLLSYAYRPRKIILFPLHPLFYAAMASCPQPGVVLQLPIECVCLNWATMGRRYFTWDFTALVPAA